MPFDGKYYCMGDRVEPFIRAWELQATPARANKIRAVLSSDGRRVCTVPGPDSQSERYVFEVSSGVVDRTYQQVQRVYILRRAALPVDPNDIEYQVRYGGHEPLTQVSPRVTARYVLGEDAVTVLESHFFGVSPSIRGHACSLN